MFSQFKAELSLIESHLRHVTRELCRPPAPGLEKFWECMEYSLFSEGKRFRPLLSLLTAKALDRPPEEALPMAAAVELIHTYSLIHDDLPMLDNDDLRRGRPTNHKVYGEADALLAGDALLTLAFSALAESRSTYLRAALKRLAEAAGAAGMVGGQVLDIHGENPNEAALNDIHRLKTGALIRVSVEGTAALLGALPEQTEEMQKYGAALGFAFQLADDIQDFNPEKVEKINYAGLLGVVKTKELLKVTSDKALAALGRFDASADGLRAMIQLNLTRV